MKNDMENDEDGASALPRSQDTGLPVHTESIHTSRRHLLLRGMLKGSAVAASVVPIKTLAQTTSVTRDNQICTLSGVQSAAHSAVSRSIPTCAGYPPAHFQTLSNWPGYVAASTISGKEKDAFAENAVPTHFFETSKFRDVFPGGSNNRLLDILNSAPNSEEAHYIAALLNAIRPLSTYVFPYTPAEVVGFYSTNRSKAFELWKKIDV